MMGEAADNLSMFNLGRRRTGFSLGNDLGEIMSSLRVRFNMSCSGHIDHSQSIDTIHVGRILTWGHYAVGCKDEATVERLELINLLPPRIPIVTGEMRIFSEERIILTRQHLRMGIDIHSGSCRLLQKFLQVVKVMA